MTTLSITPTQAAIWARANGVYNLPDGMNWQLCDRPPTESDYQRMSSDGCGWLVGFRAVAVTDVEATCEGAGV